jgi:hypothetical protein
MSGIEALDTVPEFVRRLDALGVPIFTTAPGIEDEFARPGAWQDSTAGSNTARLDAWRPGHAVCAVTGVLLAVVDVDVRNGGDIAAVRRMLSELGVRVFAKIVTPSNGAHFFVAGHPDLPTTHKLRGWPGVDILSHGANVFLPGTLRPKYDGKGYLVADAADIDALAEGDEFGAEALVGWVIDHRDLPTGETFAESVPWDGTRPDRRQRAYLSKVLAGVTEQVATAAPGTRNDALFVGAMKLGSYAKGAGLEWETALDNLTSAAERSGLIEDDGERQALATIRSGYRAAKPRAVPVAPYDSADSREGTSEVTDRLGHRASRRLTLTAAAAIKPRRVRWLWDQRLALGTLSLLAGREGLGKSTAAYWLAARITRGELPGEYQGQPRGVLICATEDSWEHTIVPRLIAARADLNRAYRVEVINADDLHVGLSLPRDLGEVERAAGEASAALLLLDPLMSRLADSLDTHRDGDVRRALEPLVTVGDRTGMSVLGLMHHNKSGSTDPLQLVMGSKAFTAVARSVHTVIPDPDDETGARRLFGTPKNNLGRSDLPVLGFTIVGHAVPTEEGDAWTSRIEWADEPIEGSIADAMRRAVDAGEDRGATAEATAWLADYLTVEGDRVPSAQIRQAGAREGHSNDALKRARLRLGLTIEHVGFPRRTYWCRAVGAQSEQPARGDTPTALTTLTA